MKDTLRGDVHWYSVVFIGTEWHVDVYVNEKRIGSGHFVDPKAMYDFIIETEAKYNDDVHD